MIGSSKVTKKSNGRRRADGAEKPPTTRTKTGCMTCRKRKKKCDERKPGCFMCERGNYICVPCPSPSSVLDNKGQKDALESGDAWLPNETGPSIMDPSRVTSTAMNADVLARDYLDPTGNFGSHPIAYPLAASSFPSQLSEHTSQNRNTLTFVNDGIETVYTPLGQPHLPQTSVDFNSGYFLGGYQSPDQYAFPTGMPMFIAPNLQVPPLFAQPTLSASLPFPVPGIDTEIQRKLFHHFTNVMSQVLTTSDGVSNPINHNIIPLATEDPIIMDTILSLSGSHILKLRRISRDPVLYQEKCRLHDRAKQTQAQRVQRLLNPSPNQQYVSTPQEQERMFATSLFLCLHEICEGSENDSSQQHLDAAREILNMIHRKSAMNTGLGAAENPPSVNHFLLEFFLYHDSLATVTMPPSQSQHDYLKRFSNIPSHDVSVVGVNDGLVHFIKRIALFREEVEKSLNRSNSKSDLLPAELILQGVSIDEDLRAWEPAVKRSEDYQNITELYRYALSIWLFSIMNPNKKSDIQGLVRWLTGKLGNLGDSVKACLLFPLFMVGGAAIDPEDRAAITDIFHKLRDWSSLGNIEVTLRVVSNLWGEYDAGVPKAWDWVTQLKKQGRSLLVT